MNANNAEICRVGNLEADFQQVPLVQFFLNFSQYCCKMSIIQIMQSNLTTIFFIKKSQKNTLLQKLHRPVQFSAVNLILGYIFENKTQKQKRQMVSDKIWSFRTKYFHLK